MNSKNASIKRDCQSEFKKKMLPDYSLALRNILWYNDMWIQQFMVKR